MACRSGVGSTSQRLVSVAWMTTASGRVHWSAKQLLVDDETPAATTGAIGEQEVLEAMARAPRREFDKTIRRQRNATTSESVIGHELDAVRELLVGVAWRDIVDRVRSSAVLQGDFELLPGHRVDAKGEHLGMEEPALPVLLPSDRLRLSEQGRWATDRLRPEGDLQDRRRERAGSARKRSSARGVGWARGATGGCERVSSRFKSYPRNHENAVKSRTWRRFSLPSTLQRSARRTANLSKECRRGHLFFAQPRRIACLLGDA